MPVIDLTRYIVASAGTWTDPTQDTNLFQFALADTMSPGRLLLRWAGDFVALTGPLRVRVTVQAENMTVPLALVGNLQPDPAAAYEFKSVGSPGASAPASATFRAGTALSEAALSRFGKLSSLGLQAGTIYSYTLDIAAGQAWPFSLAEQLNALRLQGLGSSRFEQLGNNLGFRVIIEPAFTTPSCSPTAPTSDLPCDFAVADRPNTASFFPVACEPCQGTVIGLPPAGSVTLITPPAEGGCVRTRFFNGMFITREDLETEQRYHRLKSKLHNRAAGSGVVWGLGIGMQASQVCVMPGYGVDCCGNDLALTTVYKVDVAALLADPAAAGFVRLRGPQRLHLLLEYVECPTDPRPVHGDPCAPEASRCEMSRVRESVRLRLVPPRDYDAARESAPIKRFLDQVRALQARFPLGPGPSALNVARPPFTLEFTATDATGATQRLSLRPTPNVDLTGLTALLGADEAGVRRTISSLLIQVVPDPLWQFVAGSLSGAALAGGNPMANLVDPPAPVDLALSGNGLASPKLAVQLLQPVAGAAIPNQFVFRIDNWQAQHALAGEDDPAYRGTLALTAQLDVANASYAVSNPSLSSTVDLTRLGLAARPCGGEPCTVRPTYERGDPKVFGKRDPCASPESADAAGAYRAAYLDPTPVLPWLHADPAHSGAAGDPKVLLLAALGGWLSQLMVRDQAGTANEITTTRREIAQGIYRAAWLLLFGVADTADAAVLGSTLKRLLEDWCCGSLWKGPECCGDPHGVVIGCAVVEAGTLRAVDPFGGRRNVVHYPLLAHWGAQFGLAPLDVVASRFFSTLCCVSALPAVSPTRPKVPGSAINVGNGLLLVGDRSQFATQLREGDQLVSERRVGTIEFVASVIQALSTNAPGKPRDQGQSYNAIVLGDWVADQTITLLLPA